MLIYTIFSSPFSRFIFKNHCGEFSTSVYKSSLNDSKTTHYNLNFKKYVEIKKKFTKNVQ